MKDFSVFIKNSSVKKQSMDIHTAQATAKGGKDRLALAKSIFKTQLSKFVLENAYEAIREYIDAILYLDGYKSYSHEASIAYLEQLGFSASEIGKVNWLRKKRNGIKYYGEDASRGEAEESLKIAQEMLKKLTTKRKELK